MFNLPILNALRGRIAGNPIGNALELSIFLRNECAAEGWRIQGDTLLALRWDDSGNEVIVERFALADDA